MLIGWLLATTGVSVAARVGDEVVEGVALELAFGLCGTVAVAAAVELTCGETLAPGVFICEGMLEGVIALGLQAVLISASSKTSVVF
jgi:hypothetical protein